MVHSRLSAGRASRAPEPVEHDPDRHRAEEAGREPGKRMKRKRHSAELPIDRNAEECLPNSEHSPRVRLTLVFGLSGPIGRFA